MVQGSVGGVELEDWAPFDPKGNEGRKGLDGEEEVEVQQKKGLEEEEVEGRKGLSNGERSCGSTLSLFFDGRKQYEKRARIRTRATPMAEYQIEDTSYKSRWLLPR